MMDQRKMQATQYLEKQIQNASPAQRIVMLYDGAIKFLLKAQKAIEEGDIQERCNANSRAIQILSYLMETLDIKKGGEIGEKLLVIYAHLLKRMLDIDVKNSHEAATEVIEHLRVLRSSWDQISKGAPSEKQKQENTPDPKLSDNPAPIKRSALV